MKVALTTNVLAVPPTYFIVSHAQKLADRYRFEVFALMADVRDPSVTIPVHDFTAFPKLDPSRRIYFAPLAGAEMAKGISAFNPEIIHQHFATWSGPAISAAKKLAAPLLTTVHGYDVRALSRPIRGPMNFWHRRNVQAIQSESSRVLAVSKYLADEAIAVGFDPQRLEVHYQGVDTDFFSPPSDTGETPDVPLISFVGALSPHKGPLDLVRASIALIAKYDHRLQLIGSGPLEGAIRELALQFPHIELLGRVSKDAVRKTLMGSRAMVLPSQESHGGREAAGLVLLEAQACGTPVIAYDSGGIAEMMDAGTTGTLVPERDVAQLTVAIREVLLLSAGEYARVGAAARDFVVKKRSLTLSSVELERHYSDLM
jgi:glycosyltransferase involved in cell wall biosynthesis